MRSLLRSPGRTRVQHIPFNRIFTGPQAAGFLSLAQLSQAYSPRHALTLLAVFAKTRRGTFHFRHPSTLSGRFSPHYSPATIAITVFSENLPIAATRVLVPRAQSPYEPSPVPGTAESHNQKTPGTRRVGTYFPHQDDPVRETRGPTDARYCHNSAGLFSGDDGHLGPEPVCTPISGGHHNKPGKRNNPREEITLPAGETSTVTTRPRGPGGY